MKYLAVVLHNPRRIRPSRQLLLELALISTVYLLYSLVRAFADGRETEAVARAMEVVSVERALGIYHEQTLQALLLDFPPLLRVLNILYSSAHLPALAL